MSNLKLKTLLLVEDEAIVAMMEARQLEKQGYKVVVANSGEKAIDFIRTGKDPIDLILMDIDLGKGMDGTQSAQEMLNILDIPVVFLSSHTEKDVVEKTEKITSYGYVVKNTGITVLDASIKMAFKLFEAKVKERTAKRIMEARLFLIEYSKSHTMDELLTRTLDLVGEYVQSPIGFFHFLESDQKTLTLQQWSTKTLNEFSRAEGKGSHYSIDQAGVWVDCVYQKKPVIHNDYVSLSHKHGIPEGIAPVIRELVVPVIREDKIVAILGVGNKAIDYNNDDVEIVSNLADISWQIIEQKRIEDAHRESEKQYRLLFENAIEGISVHEIITDDTGNAIDFRFLDANEAYERHSGFRRAEIIGRTMREIMPNIDPFQIQRYGRVAASGEPLSFEYYSKAFGRYLHVNAFSPGPGRFATIFEDITDRKKTEKLLQQNEERLRLSLYAANQGLYDLNVQTGNTIVNDEYARMLGYDPEIFIETNAAWIERLHPDDNDITSKAYTDYISGLIPEYRVEFRQKTKDGQWKWILSLGKIVEYDVEGKPLRMLGTHTDINERKFAEEKIRSLLSEKELILKEVHHRIKNNMSVISGLLTMQMQNQSNPDVKKILLDATSRVQSMKVLYDKLYCSEFPSELSMKEYLPSLINEIMFIFPNAASVKVKTQIDEVILTSKILSPLGIIINELITNAMKYAFVGRDNGVISIKASKCKNHLLLIFEDNGVEIPDSVTLENPKGFGLQLISALVKQINGSITMERINGTKFIIEFPV